MSKYHAKPTTIDSYRFDSLAEARHYKYLKLLEQAGEISNLEVHPRYVIFDGEDASGKRHVIRYEGDFAYQDENGQMTVCDVKGVLTPVYRLKKKLFVCRYPMIKLVEVRA